MEQAHRPNSNLPKTNRLVRMMILNWAFGWGVGFVCAAALLASNVSHIRDMISKSDYLWQFLLLTFGSFGLTFGGVVAATAIMLLPIEESEGPGGGTRAPIFLPAYALARIRGARG